MRAEKKAGKNAVWNYVKIDLRNSRSLLALFLLADLLVFLVVARRHGGANTMFVIGYDLFLGSILASMPLRNGQIGELGFYRMLPAKAQSQILGHFTYGALIQLIYFALGILPVLIGRISSVFTYAARTSLSSCLSLLGISLIFIGFVDLLLYAVNFRNPYIVNLVRVASPLLFFFFMDAFSIIADEGNTIIFTNSALSSRIYSPAGILRMIGLAGFLLYLLFGWIAVRIAIRREGA